MKSIIYNMKEEYLSLFDYLGKPAGEALGLEVATAAGKAGEPTKRKMVTNAKYTGPVNMFRKEFLKEYFENKQR